MTRAGVGSYDVDIVPRRDQLARYGLTIDTVQDVIATALGGEVMSRSAKPAPAKAVATVSNL